MRLRALRMILAVLGIMLTRARLLLVWEDHRVRVLLMVYR